MKAPAWISIYSPLNHPAAITQHYHDLRNQLLDLQLHKHIEAPHLPVSSTPPRLTLRVREWGSARGCMDWTKSGARKTKRPGGRAAGEWRLQIGPDVDGGGDEPATGGARPATGGNA
nr:unnamed protein product [Digitaria exilis]